MRYLVNTLVVLVIALGRQFQQPVIPLRLAISYALFGPTAIDTAQATRTFIGGLVADSVVRILPPLASTNARSDDGGRQQAARYMVMLAVNGLAVRPQLELRAVNVETGRMVLREATQPSADRLQAVLDSLGRLVAKRLVNETSSRAPGTR